MKTETLSDVILLKYEDYLRVEIRLAPHSVSTYLIECRIFLEYLKLNKKNYLLIKAPDIVEYLVAQEA